VNYPNHEVSITMKTIEEVLAAFEVAALKAGLRRNTRRTYAGTIEEFSGLLKSRQIDGVQGYLDYLATVKKLSPNTVWHALNPLKFFYEKVLDREFGNYDLPKRNRSKPMRSVLGMDDVARMMARMDRLARLQTGLLAGTGMRIESDMLQLRLKDVRLKDRVLTIYEAKGGKSRALAIPETVVADLEIHVEAVRRMWERDRARGIIYPHPEESLMRKLSRNTFRTLPWCWLFPSRKVHGVERWHATDKALVTALKEAAAAENIFQRVNPHALRHSYATGLLANGVDVKVIQEQLGHTSLETTSLYLHTAGKRTVASPLDRVVIPFQKSA
jgi:site-specific recombinase XerD